MTRFLVVTIACPDRPGIVERVTDVVVAHGGNWEESRLARLGGEFAGIVKVRVPAAQADELTSALTALATAEMTVVVTPAEPGPAAGPEGHTLCSLRLEGADHEGIVHQVSAFLAGQGVNVEALETELVPAPMSATPLFQMEARLDLPPSVSLEELRESLRDIGDRLGVGIEISAAPGA